jgi:hypothetical protein
MYLSDFDASQVLNSHKLLSCYSTGEGTYSLSIHSFPRNCSPDTLRRTFNVASLSKSQPIPADRAIPYRNSAIRNAHIPRCCACLRGLRGYSCHHCSPRVRCYSSKFRLICTSDSPVIVTVIPHHVISLHPYATTLSYHRQIPTQWTGIRWWLLP